MLGDKSQVDKHVYHLLAKCCNLNERKSKALEIAKLYHGVNEFATAKSYVEGYLQSRPDSVPAYLLLAKISEDLDDLSAALSAYKSVCSLSSCDKGTVLHACSLALESKELSEVQFWADMAESMFPSEKIAFMLKERVLISKNDDSELLKLLKSQLKKDESDSEVCVRFLNLLHKLRPATNVFTHLVQCINAGHHLGIASWFYECLSLVERMDQSSVNISLDTKSVCLIRAVCLMELVRVTAQTSCLSDMHNLLMKLELVANELSKSKSRILNALQSYAVIWLDFYGGVYAERRLMDSPTESADNFQHLLVYHFYQRVVSNQRPEIFHGSSSLSALVWSHLHRESFSLRTQATHLVHLFASLHDDLRPNEQGVNFRSLPWKQLISWVNGDPVIDSFKSHASNFNIKGDYVPDLFDEKESILDYLPSADCLNLIMWVCAQQLSLQNSSCEDFTLSIPRLDFLYKLVTKLFSKLEFCCTSPVFGSPAEFQSLSNVSVDQLCQIDIIGFMMSCFLHISIRSLSKANSKYSQPICSHLLVKPATAGTGLDFLCLPLCLIPTAQLSTSTQRAWWSALVKQVFESGSRTTIDDGNRSLLRCGLNQLRLVFHSTCCLNGESGMMSPPLLFRIAGGLTYLVKKRLLTEVEKIEPWPSNYWQTALRNYILGPSTDQKFPMMQSLNGSFCSGHTNSLGISRCFSPLQNRNVTQSNKSEISGPHILFLLPSSYNSWYGVTDDSDSVASLYRQWCNKGWLWCFNQIESRFKVSGELNTKDEDLLQFLVHLRDYDPSICDETTYSCSKKLLARLVDKSKSHEFNSLRADEEATSKVIHHQKFNNTESEKSNMKSSQHGSPTEINDSEISTPTVFKSSIAQKPQTFVSPLMKVNTVNPTSPLKVANDKRSTKTDNSEQSDAEPMQTARSPQNFTSSSSINTPICSPSKTPTGSIHHILPTLSCSLVGFYNSLQSTAGVQVSHTVAVDQTHSSTHLQDSCLSNLISVWQTLVSGLSCQLAETKAELMRTRELNEQLSKQLNQTSKQLSEAVDKFLEIEKNNRVISKNPTETPVPSTTTSVLETPIGELSKAITELRQWLPEGMASAACAAVSARLTTVHAKSLGQHQSPSHSESFVQANNTEKSPEKLKSSTIVSSSKSQDEDAEQFPEAYEPTMNFKPVLETLPDLVELKSGEENEQRLFCERARLFHWDKESESWKTKGIGEVRILKNLNTGKCRLVMGRDQVKKLCANHCITSSTKLSPSTKDPRMTMWAAKDYSESMEGVDEVFMIQFKSTETLNEFSRVFSECTAKIDGNAIAEFSSEVKYKSFEKNLPVTQSQAPSAAGVQLTSSAPKPPITESNNKTQASKQVDSILSKFAPKSGSWECPTCLLYHDSSVSLCSACQTPKPGSMGEANIITSKANTSTPLFGGFLKSAGGFVFGHSKASESTVSVTASTTSITTTTTPKPVFSFVSTSPKLNTNIFPTTSSQTSLSKSFTFTSSATTMTISSSFGHTFPSVFPTTLSTSETKPALQTSVSTTTTSGQSGFTFSFGDALSKLNQSSKLPTSVPTPTHGDSHVDENGDDDKVELVDDSKLTFKPVLEVIPKKIEVVTGEENDEVIFCRRAKLYRWDDKTWHERGVGDLKLLRSTVTGVIRCLMRRDHVLKVCCNHAIGVGMQLKPLNTGGGRAWSWWAIDYSEQSDEVNQTNETDSSVLSGGKRETFAARFKLTEHSEEFRALFEEAVQAAENRLNTSQSSEKKPPKKETVDLDQQEEDTDSDVVVVELPLKVSSDQVSQARRLKLPDEFYSYENGEVTGEPEHLTAQEEAEEDALLEAAIRGYAKTTTDQSASDCSVTPTQLSKQSDTENKAITGLSSATYMFQSKGLIDFSALNAAVSKVDQPTWGSSTKTSVWSNVGAPLFAKPTGETDQNEEDPSGTEHDPHYEPIVALPKLAETKTGEEEELCIFLRRCRAYRYVDKEWKERGVGEIKVLVRPRTMPADAHYGPRDVVPLEYKLTDIGRARILMRRDQILKLCLNHPISVDLPVLKPMSQSASGNSLCWVGEDYSEGSGSLETLAVRFKFDTDANEFKAAVARAQSALKSS